MGVDGFMCNTFNLAILLRNSLVLCLKCQVRSIDTRNTVQHPGGEPVIVRLQTPISQIPNLVHLLHT